MDTYVCYQALVQKDVLSSLFYLSFKCNMKAFKNFTQSKTQGYLTLRMAASPVSYNISHKNIRHRYSQPWARSVQGTPLYWGKHIHQWSCPLKDKEGGLCQAEYRCQHLIHQNPFLKLIQHVREGMVSVTPSTT